MKAELEAPDTRWIYSTRQQRCADPGIPGGEHDFQRLRDAGNRLHRRKLLGEPLGQAKEAGIPVISYDRLLMNSDAVSYYATFDNYMVGRSRANIWKGLWIGEETTGRSISSCSPATQRQ